MKPVPVSDLADTLKLPVSILIKQLKRAGVAIGAATDLVSVEQRDALLRYLRSSARVRNQESTMTLDNLREASDLRELNALLTQAMAERQIQNLIKDDGLEEVVSFVFERVHDREDELFAAAELGRLAAVARNRESVVFDRADDVFSGEPSAIDTLDDGDAKNYAAQLLTHVSASWLGNYAYRESVAIDSADNARRELLSACLEREQSVAGWVAALRDQAGVLGNLGSPEAKLRRWKRILSVMGEILERWRGDVGASMGVVLAEFLPEVIGKTTDSIDDTLLFDVLDQLLRMLGRVIELRFSMALYAATYAALQRGKSHVGAGRWAQFINHSQNMPRIRVALLEAALVLARQNRTDKEILAALLACYSSRPQVASAVKRHFLDARDLDPDVREWWCCAGEVPENRRVVEHRVGNNEDVQIGSLLIEVESNQDAMEKVGRAVVPLLEISEPVLASTVRKAVTGYQSVAQMARRLARMRKLTRMDLKGERLEYNALEHEMLGGHKSGVRRVRVVRDGIKKEFSGKVKTLVKPWVEPDE